MLVRLRLLALTAVLLAGCVTAKPEVDPFEAIPKASAMPKDGKFTRILTSDIDTPAYRLPENPLYYALIVGIEKYQALPDAQFAERDAASMREHLRALGFPDRNIVFLAGKGAGKAALRKYLDSWLPLNVAPGARVFFYFSGHGAPGPETGQAYLVPYDGDLEFLETTAYSTKALYESLNALNAKEVIVAMDACFSGAGGRSVMARGTRPLVAKIDTRPAQGSKLVVLSAAGPDEVTGSDEAQGHGLFTYHLLSAFNQRKGRLSVKDAYLALRSKVADAARRQNRDQTARLDPEDQPEKTAVRFDELK